MEEIKQRMEELANILEEANYNYYVLDNPTTNIAMAKKYGWNTCQAYGYELEKIKTKVQAFLENNKKSKLFNKKKVYSDILLTTH